MLKIACLGLVLVSTAGAQPAMAQHGRRATAAPSGQQLILQTQAEAPGKINLEAAEIVAELIGAPVFAAGGVEVGQIADISFDEQGRPERLRMTTERGLALGKRTVELPKGAFMVLRGAAVLDLTPEAVRLLPALGENER